LAWTGCFGWTIIAPNDGDSGCGALGYGQQQAKYRRDSSENRKLKRRTIAGDSSSGAADAMASRDDIFSQPFP
jgi:hypothetical protein